MATFGKLPLQARRLSQAEAAEILGMSERTFRRWRDRYDTAGRDGLCDRRRGRCSSKRVPAGELNRMLELDRSRHTGFRAKRCHEKLRQHHDFALSYSWTKRRLQDAGLVAKAPRRSAHRKKRPTRPLRHAAAPGLSSGRRRRPRGTARPTAGCPGSSSSSI